MKSTDAYNDIDNPDRVVPEQRQLIFQNGVVELPPHSLIIVNVAADYCKIKHSVLDSNDDCIIDLTDFVEFAKEWLYCV